MRLELLTIHDSARWEHLLGRFPEEATDIYFSPRYYRTWESVHDGEAVCLFAESGGHCILYPFYKRGIDGLDGEFFDISSAYGYGGAISTADVPDEDMKREFSELVSEWCLRENVVAEFIREYPGATLRNTGAVKRTMVRTNLYVDTGAAPDALWAGLKGSARRNVAAAMKGGVEAVVDESLDTMDGFRRLYSHTACDRGFDGFYHFPQGYFESMKELLGGDAVIINAVHEGGIIASVLCLQSGAKLSYHLGASMRDRANLRANDLLYWEMIIQAHKRGCRVLQLGGGMGLGSDDSLFRFKSKFATRELPFHIETCVHNKEVYESLCMRWEEKYPTLVARKGRYFLKYRESG